ncbi:MAG TPA: enoyl-CoA hydratase/isomerase family protein [Acidimicrobiales bacterium]|jgi:enoyl-CoA hydratase/carnithine racemase|nr:enoyl-CoA hydratase/isomerase family protein [Acidimicrobiales bacterium]
MTFTAIDVEQDKAVATIRIKPFERTQREGGKHPGYVDVHTAIAEALERFRWDDSVRIIVITGSEDGEFYWAPGPGYYDQERLDRMNPVKRGSGRFSHEQGAARITEALAMIEKPVIARVNGHASSNGQSILFGCDLIVAREDAIITENHLGLGEVTDEEGVPHGYPFPMTPGDGAGALVPLYMTPTKAKEYLFLSPAYTAKELAAMNIVNYAVPMDQLDVVLNDLIEKLLKRPARTLARTKRGVNKMMIQQVNLAYDALGWSESLDFYELGRNNWKPDLSFEPQPPAS